MNAHNKRCEHSFDSKTQICRCSCDHRPRPTCRETAENPCPWAKTQPQDVVDCARTVAQHLSVSHSAQPAPQTHLAVSSDSDLVRAQVRQLLAVNGPTGAAQIRDDVTPNNTACHVALVKTNVESCYAATVSEFVHLALCDAIITQARGITDVTRQTSAYPPSAFSRFASIYGLRPAESGLWLAHPYPGAAEDGTCTPMTSRGTVSQGNFRCGARDGIGTVRTGR